MPIPFWNVYVPDDNAGNVGLPLVTLNPSWNAYEPAPPLNVGVPLTVITPQ
jgi:hypothetical protein